jgi:hypothetical protein
VRSPRGGGTIPLDVEAHNALVERRGEKAREVLYVRVLTFSLLGIEKRSGPAFSLSRLRETRK